MINLQDTCYITNTMGREKYESGDVFATPKGGYWVEEIDGNGMVKVIPVRLEDQRYIVDGGRRIESLSSSLLDLMETWFIERRAMRPEGSETQPGNIPEQPYTVD